MALPAAIQAQVEQADALLAAMNAPPTQPQVPEAPQVDLAQLAQTAPADNAIPQAATPAPAPVQSAPSEETWERKFKSLQGIFNKEVPTLQQQVKDLTRRLEQTVQQMEANKQPVPEPVTHKPEADPKDVENFGSDLVEMVQRVTERMFGSVAQKVDTEFAKVATRLASLEQQLIGTTQSVAATAEDKFFERLEAKVPHWADINEDPRFIEWLQEVDPVYGLTRKTALAQARDQLDVARVVNVFTAFAGQPVQAPVPNAVDKQVSPKSGASGQAPTQQVKPILTQKQITDFYNDVARRKYAGREAEAAGIELAINQAIAEGRVR